VASGIIGGVWAPVWRCCIVWNSGAINDDAVIGASLAKILRSVRPMISVNQALISDPAKGVKGLTGKMMLAEAMKNFHDTPCRSPAASADGCDH